MSLNTLQGPDISFDVALEKDFTLNLAYEAISKASNFGAVLMKNFFDSEKIKEYVANESSEEFNVPFGNRSKFNCRNFPGLTERASTLFGLLEDMNFPLNLRSNLCFEISGNEREQQATSPHIDGYTISEDGEWINTRLMGFSIITTLNYAAIMKIHKGNDIPISKWREQPEVFCLTYYPGDAILLRQRSNDLTPVIHSTQSLVIDELSDKDFRKVVILDCIKD
jgi:hypothetical protein